MRYFLFVFIFILTFSSQKLWSVETCSRIAVINYQEVLVDSNVSEKGEGLRYHLEKDPIALELLNTYQKNSAIRWPNAILGTAGTGLLLFGFFTSDSQDRQIYLISSGAVILVNFLVARTLEVANESNLNKAVEEYNKRNLPKIYFSPETNNPQANSILPAMKIGFIKDWSF